MREQLAPLGRSADLCRRGDTRGLPGRAGTRGGQHSARTGQRAGQIARLPPEKPYGANADRQKDEQRGEA